MAYKRGFPGHVLSHVQPSDRWKSEDEPNSNIQSLGLDSIYRWISTQDPQAGEIHALRDQYRKTKKPKLLAELQSKVENKLNQAVALISSLHVGKAVYLHGLAGDIAASLHGQQSMIATDIINCLGEAFAVCEAEALSKFVYLQR